MKKFNKFISLILSVIMILSIVPLTADAAEISGTCGENLIWTFAETTGTLTISGEGAMEDYEESHHDCYRPSWYDYRQKIKKFVIENGVTSIGDYAFYSYHNLTEVIIPDSVTEIGYLSICSNSLTEITIPNTIKTFGYEFVYFKTLINYKGTSTEWIALRDSDRYDWLGMYIVNCLDKTVAPSGYCGENVTWEMDLITNCLTISGYGAMVDERPNIQNNVLWGHLTDRIQSVVINEGVETIGNHAFFNCINLTKVSIPKSITRIGECAFLGCENLKNVVIPNSVIEIGPKAFSACDLLTEIFVPASVTIIGDGAFAAPEGIFVDKGNQCYSSDENGVLFNKDKTILMQYPSNASNEYYEVPESVTTINGSAFYQSNNLKNISMHSGVTSIGREAFKLCKNLESIIIPGSVTEIGDFSFQLCGNLKSVTFSDGVKKIGEYAFYKCERLKSVDISNTVTTIGSEAFQYCTSLRKIIIPDSVTTIGTRAFASSGLENIVLGKGLTTIRPNTFERCKRLREIVIPENVTVIESGAFSDSRLERIWIPESVVEIQASVFYLYPNYITDVYYMGTKKQWAKVKVVDYNNDGFKKAKIHYSCRKEEVPATCTEQGSITYFCGCCGAEKLYRYTDLLEHNYIGVETPATCTKHGITDYTCQDCGASYFDYTANPTGHNVNADGVCESCGKTEVVNTTASNNQLLSFDSILQLIMNLISKMFDAILVL